MRLYLVSRGSTADPGHQPRQSDCAALWSMICITETPGLMGAFFFHAHLRTRIEFCGGAAQLKLAFSGQSDFFSDRT